MFREHHALPNQPRLFRPHLRGAAQSKAPKRAAWESLGGGERTLVEQGRGTNGFPAVWSLRALPVGNRMTFSFYVVCKETLLEITLGVV